MCPLVVLFTGIVTHLALLDIKFDQVYNFNFVFYYPFPRTYEPLCISLVPRPRPAFCHLQYGKVGESLVSFLM